MWSNSSKDWDREKPLHRINNPFYSESAGPVNGRGYDCGCRSPAQTPRQRIGHEILAADLMRMIPPWVPVLPELGGAPCYREVEGLLSRSYQTWTDVPLAQWHIWYDWNFHLVPAPGYGYIRGLGNEHEGSIASGQRLVVQGETMECEWDCGAIQRERSGPGNMGPMFFQDLAWPMAGQYVWLSGRWIYDCGHANSSGLMRSELHPCLAVATARWEAVNFRENGFYTPAIQFMFFISKFGGYFDFPSIAERDYEFLVDLPQRFWEVMEHRISRTAGDSPQLPRVRGGTVRVSRPELLQSMNHAAFASTRGYTDTWDAVQLEVEIHRNDAGSPQARIHLPLRDQVGSLDSWGTILSLGWRDHTGFQAQFVYEVRVTFESIKWRRSRGGPAKVYFKFGTNGRWFSRVFDSIGIRADPAVSLGPVSVEFRLGINDPITISSHGAELDRVGDYMERPPRDRTLRIDGRSADWNRDIVAPGRQTLPATFNAIALEMASTLNAQNRPLGLVDHTFTARQILRSSTGSGPGGEGSFRLLAHRAGELGDSAELAENLSEPDYELRGRIRVRPQGSDLDI